MSDKEIWKFQVEKTAPYIKTNNVTIVQGVFAMQYLCAYVKLFRVNAKGPMGLCILSISKQGHPTLGSRFWASLQPS